MRRRRPGKIPAANNKCVGAATAASLHATDTQLMRTQCSPLCVCVCVAFCGPHLHMYCLHVLIRLHREKCRVLESLDNIALCTAPGTLCHPRVPARTSLPPYHSSSLYASVPL